MIDGLVWRANPSTVKRVVIPAVLELFLDATADLKMETRRHGHITGIEQAVDVASQQESVPRLVFTAVAIGTNMRSF